MKLINVQLTLVIPEKVQFDYEIMSHLAQNLYAKKLVREGRILTSYGITRKEANETEVVVNYE